MEDQFWNSNSIEVSGKCLLRAWFLKALYCNKKIFHFPSSNCCCIVCMVYFTTFQLTYKLIKSVFGVYVTFNYSQLCCATKLILRKFCVIMYKSPQTLSSFAAVWLKDFVKMLSLVPLCKLKHASYIEEYHFMEEILLR